MENPKYYICSYNFDLTLTWIFRLYLIPKSHEMICYTIEFKQENNLG